MKPAYAGPQGPQGLQGPPGITGPPGFGGYSGYSGYSGCSGCSGTASRKMSRATYLSLGETSTASTRTGATSYHSLVNVKS